MSEDNEQTFDATVLITTKNRRDELRQAVSSALAQEGCAIEVLVIDDGSNDGTSEMICREFPAVRLDQSERSLGLIVQRNRGATLARAPLIISIDDDSAFSSPNIVAHTIRAFSDARIGAIAIPFINVRYDPAVQQAAPNTDDIFIIESYIGTAHALRREQFLQLGGYRERLFHQCEEEDYCIRLLQAGYFVRAGTGDPIHHFESPRRDLERVFVFNARNHILFAWQNVPMPYWPLHLLATMVNLVRHGLRRQRLAWTIRGMARGWMEMLGHRGERHPVSRRTYRLSRWIKRHGAVRLSSALERF